MEKNKYSPENMDEVLKEKTSAFLNFFENFNRGVENITIKDPNHIFGVKVDDSDGDIKIKLKFFSFEEKNEIQKLVNDNKVQDAEIKTMIYGIKEWNLLDNEGNPLPINNKNVLKLNDMLFKMLNLAIKAKNREPDAEEMQNFLTF